MRSHCLAHRSCRPWISRGIVPADGLARTPEVLEIEQLALGQCIHWVDADRLDSGSGPGAQHVVDDRIDWFIRVNGFGQNVPGILARGPLDADGS